MKKIFLSLVCLLAIATITKAQSTQLWGMTSSGGTSSGGTIFKINPDGTGFTTTFNFASPDGWMPLGNLIQASDGNLYNTCHEGGSFASCTICRHNPVTNVHSDIWDFDITNGDFPKSGVVEAPNGLLYGAASAGGIQGVIYSIDPATNVYTNLQNLSCPTGCSPYAVPVVHNGKLYGTTSIGGTNNFGVIYSYDIISDVYTDLFDFTGAPTGSTPYGNLYLSSDGTFYGMTWTGGVNNVGVIYNFDPSSNIYTKLYDFALVTGGKPRGGLMQGIDGRLYGVTEMGGSAGVGVIFSYDVNSGVYANLYNFQTFTGCQPVAELTQTPTGILYGSAATGGSSGFGVLFSYDLTSSIYSVIFNFSGTNGSAPKSALLAVEAEAVGISEVASSDGNFLVYPNPGADKLNIKLLGTDYENAQITISNLIGEKILSLKIERLVETIDISRLSEGMYFMELNLDNKKSVLKIVKK